MCEKEELNQMLSPNCKDGSSASDTSSKQDGGSDKQASAWKCIEKSMLEDFLADDTNLFKEYALSRQRQKEDKYVEEKRDKLDGDEKDDDCGDDSDDEEEILCELTDLTKREKEALLRKWKTFAGVFRNEGRFQYPIWDLISFCKDEYQDAICGLTANMYTLHRLCQIRYLNLAAKHFPDVKKDIRKKSQYEGEEDLAQLVEFAEGYRTDHRIPSFLDYAKSQRRHLYQMLDRIIGAENRKLLIGKKHKCNVIVYKFYSFLLDTFESDSAEKLRKNRIEELEETRYLARIRFGLKQLIKHSILKDKSDIGVVLKKWRIE